MKDMNYCVQASVCSWDLNPDPHGYIGSISPVKECATYGIKNEK